MIEELWKFFGSFQQISSQTIDCKAITLNYLLNSFLLPTNFPLRSAVRNEAEKEKKFEIVILDSNVCCDNMSDVAINSFN